MRRFATGTIALGTCFVLLGMAACQQDAPTAVRSVVMSKQRIASVGPLFLSHDGPRFSSWEEYIAAFNQAQKVRSKTKARVLGTASPATTAMSTCGPIYDESIDGTLATRGMTSAASTDPYQLGAMHIWAPAPPTGSSIPSWLYNAFFSIPGRFLEASCGEWRYGRRATNSDMRAIDSGEGIEEGDDPPSYAPPGMSDSLYAQMNLAEAAFVWRKYWEFHAKDPTDYTFGVWVGRMAQARKEAQEWAAAETPYGAYNGLQDALRHAYWSCRMTQLVGIDDAIDAGNAHEKYTVSPAEARMDYYNNEKGRMITSQFTSCAAGTRWLRSSGLLQTSVMPAPTSTRAPSPPPPVYDY